MIDIETAVKNFDDSEDACATSNKLAERDIDYYHGYQLTNEEKTVLAKRGQPEVVDNRIKPKINNMVGREMAQRTDPKAYPRTREDEEGAEAATDAIRYVCEANDFHQVKSFCYQQLLLSGVCGAEVIVKEKKGKYEIKINGFHWDRLFYDPHSRSTFFADAGYFGGVLWMDLEDAIAKWPKAKTEIEATMSGASTDTYDDKPAYRWADTTRNRVQVIQMYYLDGGKWYFCEFVKSGFLRSPEECGYKDDEGEPEPALILQSAFVDRDGNRYGVVRQFISLQDEVNKRRSKSLHLLNSDQTWGEVGAVADINKFKKQKARPDGHMEITPGLKFEFIDNTKKIQGNFELLQEAKESIEANGVNSVMQGRAPNSMSGRAMELKESQGSLEMGPVVDALKHFEKRIYRAIWNRIKQYWTDETWIRITDDEKNVKFVGLNKKTTIGQQLIERANKEGQPLDEEQLQMLMSDPRSQVEVTENNTAKMKVDIILEDSPDTVTIQQEQFDSIVSIYPSIPQKYAEPAFEMLVESSNLRGKKAFIEKLKGQNDPEAAKAAAEMQKQQQEQMQIQMETMKAQLDKLAAETEKIRATAHKELALTESIMEGDLTPDRDPVKEDTERANQAATMSRAYRDFAMGRKITAAGDETGAAAGNRAKGTNYE